LITGEPLVMVVRNLKPDTKVSARRPNDPCERVQGWRTLASLVGSDGSLRCTCQTGQVSLRQATVVAGKSDQVPRPISHD
jgi:hypothetical protein